MLASAVVCTLRLEEPWLEAPERPEPLTPAWRFHLVPAPGLAHSRRHMYLSMIRGGDNCLLGGQRPCERGHTRWPEALSHGIIFVKWNILEGEDLEVALPKATHIQETLGTLGYL